MKIIFYETTSSQKNFFQSHLQGVDCIFTTNPTPQTVPTEQKDAQIISVFIDSHITKELLDQFPKLTLIVTRSTGYDHIDLAACEQRNITVHNTPGYATTAVAEYTFALLLRLMRHICSSENIQGSELFNKQLGIIGTGRIGKHVARIAHGFGMKLCAFDVCIDEGCVRDYDVAYCSLDQLYANSDIISVHVPLLPATRYMINHEAVKRMKPGMILVNTSRGEIIENAALLQGLHDNIIAAAALDVIEPELEQHVRDYSNVIITPHNAYNTHESEQRMLYQTVQYITTFIEKHL